MNDTADPVTTTRIRSKENTNSPGLVHLLEPETL